MHLALDFTIQSYYEEVERYNIFQCGSFNEERLPTLYIPSETGMDNGQHGLLVEIQNDASSHSCSFWLTGPWLTVKSIGG